MGDNANHFGAQKGGGDTHRMAVKVRDVVKVDAERLDQLVDAIGELVISESILSQSTEFRSVASAEFQHRLGEFGKITRELQQIGTALRMMPVHSTFQKMSIGIKLMTTST